LGDKRYLILTISCKECWLSDFTHLLAFVITLVGGGTILGNGNVLRDS